MPSRLPQQSSTLFANNVTKLLQSMLEGGEKQTRPNLVLNMSDVVCRGCTVLLRGDLAWPAPAAPPPPPPAAKPKANVVDNFVSKELQVRQETLTAAVGTAGVTTSLLALNMLSADPAFLAMCSTLTLAGCAGYQAVWSVTPALHTPLMSGKLVGIGSCQSKMIT